MTGQICALRAGLLRNLAEIATLGVFGAFAGIEGRDRAVVAHDPGPHLATCTLLGGKLTHRYCCRACVHDVLLGAGDAQAPK